MSRRGLVPEDCVYRRAGHVMVSFDNKLYLWGGYMEEPFEENYNYTSRSSTCYHPSDEVWVYDPLLDTWSRKICSDGKIPGVLSGACAAVQGENMYLFGGYIGDPDFTDDSNHTSDKLWRLHLPTLTWTLLSPLGFKPYPCDKASCWVYKNRFYVFGGFGLEVPYNRPPPSKVIFEAEFQSIRPRGWVDQLVYYDIDENSWVWPKDDGEKPSPRAAHAAAVLKDKAFVFGGRHKDQRLNDFYYLDMKNHTWRKVYNEPSARIPCGRSWHTLNAISSDKLVLYGGFSTICQVLNDVWMFDSTNCLWVYAPWLQQKPRLWHRAECILDGQVLVVGGIVNNLLEEMSKDHADDMLVLRFSPPSLLMLALEFITKSNSIPQSTWKSLPPSVRELLAFRTDGTHVHGMPFPTITIGR